MKMKEIPGIQGIIQEKESLRIRILIVKILHPERTEEVGIVIFPCREIVFYYQFDGLSPQRVKVVCLQ